MSVMHLFYTQEINGSFHDLDEEESRHCVKVLRLKEGETVYLTDGKGRLYRCSIANANPKQCRIIMDELLPAPTLKSWNVHIGIAPTKNPDRLEWFAEKATEIGIDEITPVFCDHSERKILKTMRFEKVIISAMKQSLRIYKPRFNDPVDFSQLVTRPYECQKFIASCETGQEEELSEKYRKGSDVLILIGPEGDFSAKEIEKAESAGFIPISLGNHRLRTETAGIVACHTINMINK